LWVPAAPGAGRDGRGAQRQTDGERYQREGQGSAQVTARERRAMRSIANETDMGSPTATDGRVLL